MKQIGGYSFCKSGQVIYNIGIDNVRSDFSREDIIQLMKLLRRWGFYDEDLKCNIIEKASALTKKE